MVNKFETRGRRAFEASLDRIEADLQRMISLHAKEGRLQSGLTIRSAIQIFERHSDTVLQDLLSEVSKLVENRGSKWNNALDGISRATRRHYDGASVVLKGAMTAAGVSEAEDAKRAADRLLLDGQERLLSKISEFRDGWTAPSPKPWKDRSPTLFAIAMILIGAFVANADRIYTKIAVAIGYR